MNRTAKIAIGLGLVVLVGSAAGMSITVGRKKATEVKIEAVKKQDLVAVVTSTNRFITEPIAL